MAEIIHYPERERFETVVDGITAYVDYEIHGNALCITHTIVPKEIGGRGIAAQLVEAAYNYADSQGLDRDASCSYAIIWMQRHPKQ